MPADPRCCSDVPWQNDDGACSASGFCVQFAFNLRTETFALSRHGIRKIIYGDSRTVLAFKKKHSSFQTSNVNIFSFPILENKIKETEDIL